MKISFHTALVTGSSRGLGRSIAVKLAREGVQRIAVHYLTRKNEAEKTLALLRDAGAEGVLVQGDTSNAQRAREIVDEAARDLGGCDIFVQSVAPQLDKIYEHTLATEVPLEKWQLAFDTQARAFFVGASAAAKYMTEGGRILAYHTDQEDKLADGSRGWVWVRPRQHWRVCAGISRFLSRAMALP